MAAVEWVRYERERYEAVRSLAAGLELPLTSLLTEAEVARLLELGVDPAELTVKYDTEPLDGRTDGPA